MLDEDEHPLKSETVTLYVPANRFIRVVSLIMLEEFNKLPLLSVQIIEEKFIPLPPVIFTSRVPSFSSLQEILFPL